MISIRLYGDISEIRNLSVVQEWINKENNHWI